MSLPLTDRTALALHRRRADPNSGLFLHSAARGEIDDRLALVNKTFNAVAVVTPFPDIWQGFAAGQRVVHDDEVLDLAPGSCDLVIHALALHWANDPVGQLIQCRRALRPDGLMICAALGGQTLAELRAALAEAETRLTGGLSPRVAPMGEIRDLGALLQRTGFALPVADAQTLKVSYESPLHLMRDLRAMGETNALGTRARRFTRRDVIMQAAAIYAANYAEDGRCPATFETIYLTGWAPDPSQQQPLRPGSASHRLAQALGTKETALDEKLTRSPKSLSALPTAPEDD